MGLGDAQTCRRAGWKKLPGCSSKKSTAHDDEVTQLLTDREDLPVVAVRHVGGAVLAAEDVACDFDAVPDDATAAMIANGRERVNRAFEGVEVMRDPIKNDLECFVILVPTHLTLDSRIFAQFDGRNIASLRGCPSLSFRFGFLPHFVQ